MQTKLKICLYIKSIGDPIYQGKGMLISPQSVSAYFPQPKPEIQDNLSLLLPVGAFNQVRRPTCDPVRSANMGFNICGLRGRSIPLH